MTSRPKFYLPVILPPLKDPSDPAAYYAAIEAQGAQVTADSPSGDGSLEITITNPTQPHPGQFTDPLPVSTVFAPTAGFVRYYPGSAILPTPGQQPSAPPPALTAADFGSVRTRIWVSNYAAFVKKPSADESLANQHVLCWLDPTTVEAAFATEVTKLKEKVLKRSWEDGGGTGTAPDRQGLEAAFLQRLMAGDAEIFVDAGTPLGSAVTTPSGDARLKLQTLFVPPDPDPSLPVEAEDFIDSGLEGLSAGTKALYAGDPQGGAQSHPLVEPSGSNVTIEFKSTFLIWDNKDSKYVPLQNNQVTLMKDNNVIVASATTDGNGQIDLTVSSLTKRDKIYFEYELSQNVKYGHRVFTENVRTESHRAGSKKYLGSGNVNTHVYLGKYQLYPKYRDFSDELSANADDEVFEKDRGNGETGDNSKVAASAAYLVTFASQKGRLLQIEESEKSFNEELEKYYREGHDGFPPGVFALLVEGDSWLDYPPAWLDIYGHLDKKLKQAQARNKFTYARFPLQHHGDRSDQMFEGDPLDADRQWHYTRDFLNEFKINLIVCSAGGNDLAEPGIGHWLINPGIGVTKPNNSPQAVPYKGCFNGPFDANGNGGYFDPFRMVTEQLSPGEITVAENMMAESFAVLLKNHPWNHYFNDKTGLDPNKVAALSSGLSNEMQAWVNAATGGGAFGESDPAKQRLDDTGKLVSTLPDFSYPPAPNGDPGQKLLDAVFDSARYTARFDQVKANWEVLLNAAGDRNISVLTHTYCYPLFKQNPTTHYGRQTGPWFAPRFAQAGIADLRVRCICMKAMIDHYVSYILDPLKQAFQGTFDYIDARALNRDETFWNDEMHLTTTGFGKVADLIYDKAVALFPQFLG